MARHAQKSMAAWQPTAKSFMWRAAGGWASIAGWAAALLTRAVAALSLKTLSYQKPKAAWR
jgi:hypothetical protein